MMLSDLQKYLGSAARFFGPPAILRVMWAILNYVSILFMARNLAHEDFGVFSFVLTSATLLGTFANFGIQNTVMRYIGQYRASGLKELELGVIQSAQRYSAIFAALTVVCAIFVVSVGGHFGFTHNALALSIGCLLIPGFSLVETNAAIARSYGSVFVALAPRDVVWRGLLIPASIAATQPIVAPYMQLEVFASLAVLLMAVVIFWQSWGTGKIVRKQNLNDAPLLKLKEWRSVALPLWLTSLAWTCFRTIDVVFLGFFIPPAALGGYFVASRTAALLGFVLTSANVVVGPQISRAYHSNNKVRLERILAGSAAIGFVPALILFVLYTILGEKILNFFSPEFSEFVPVLLILSLGQLVSTFCGSAGFMFSMSGHERSSLTIVVSTLLPGMIFMIFLAWLYGPIGAAVGLSCSLAILNIRHALYATKHIGHDPSLVAPVKRCLQGFFL